jgi:hypothetical protein
VAWLVSNAARYVTGVTLAERPMAWLPLGTPNALCGFGTERIDEPPGSFSQVYRSQVSRRENA